MSSKNPFGQLQVRRDEEEEDFTPQTIQASTPAQVFNTAQPEKKKKKVRPEEKRKVEEVHAEEEEGFEVVSKKKPVHRRQNETEEVAPEEKVKKHHLKNKGAYADRNNKVPAGKRQFERHSGTGRGKEIAKNGAGGKHTWGTNPKTVARDEDFSSYDDQVFNMALNAKPRERREEPVVEEAPEEQATPVEATPVVEETPKQEETPAQEGEGFDRRRKKKGFEVEVRKEDLLIRPENPLNYTEYIQQLKEKNAQLQTAPKRTVEVENSDLKPQFKENNLTIGLTVTEKKQTKPKQKERKEETVVDVAFKTGDDFERRNDNRENNRNYGNKKKGPKFQFKTEDFPEL